MDCTKCNQKNCRRTESCNFIGVDEQEIKDNYSIVQNQLVVQSAAELVDDGRAGTLSRIQEIIEFAKLMNYSRLGLAYCYGMETEAATVSQILRKNKFMVSAVSCTAGSLKQSEVNEVSKINGVSCNPLAQAMQLNREKPDLILTMGLCLGHDILFNQYIELPVTTLVVKDRLYGNDPLKGIKEYNKIN